MTERWDAVRVGSSAEEQYRRADLNSSKVFALAGALSRFEARPPELWIRCTPLNSLWIDYGDKAPPLIHWEGRGDWQPECNGRYDTTTWPPTLTPDPE